MQINKLKIFQPNNIGGSGGGGASAKFTIDPTFILSAGKSLGKYVNGNTAAWTGLTAVEALLDAAIEYIQPVFTAMGVTGQATNVEAGTTLTGSKTFTWAITQNSGVVPTVDILDVTAGNVALIAGTVNDGNQALVITNKQLAVNVTQQWRVRGNNTSPIGTFLSNILTVTGRYYIFLGPNATAPINSAQVRALPANSFYTGAGNLILNTGNVETKHFIALPPGNSFSQIIDLDALNANITTSYVNIGTVNVVDAGGVNRLYTIYQLTLGAPYSSNHRHQITVN